MMPVVNLLLSTRIPSHLFLSFRCFTKTRISLCIYPSHDIEKHGFVNAIMNGTMHYAISHPNNEALLHRVLINSNADVNHRYKVRVILCEYVF